MKEGMNMQKDIIKGFFFALSEFLVINKDDTDCFLFQGGRDSEWKGFH